MPRPGPRAPGEGSFGGVSRSAALAALMEGSRPAPAVAPGNKARDIWCCLPPAAKGTLERGEPLPGVPAALPEAEMDAGLAVGQGTCATPRRVFTGAECESGQGVPGTSRACRARPSALQEARRSSSTAVTQSHMSPTAMGISAHLLVPRTDAQCGGDSDLQQGF